MSKVRLSQYLDPELDKGYKEAAKITKRSGTAYVEWAIENQLQKDFGKNWRKELGVNP